MVILGDYRALLGGVTGLVVTYPISGIPVRFRADAPLYW
jgi:hypothetical protein